MKELLPPEPVKPLSDDCCGGGSCCPCVWDTYYENIAAWREEKRKIEGQHFPAQKADKLADK